MKIILSENAENQLSRFKRITEWDVIDFIEEKTNEEPFQDYLSETFGTVCNEFYDRDNKVIIYAEINSDHTILEVLDVRRYY